MSEVKKVTLGKPKKESEVYKVDLSNPPATEEKIEASEEETSEENVVEEVAEEVLETEEKTPVITESSEEEEEAVVIGEQPAEEPVTSKEAISQAADVPENLESLVSFMKETGGGIEDYVRLNANYDNVDGDTLLKEYYNKTKSHLDTDEINFLLEDKFEFDEDIDDERDIRKKKLAKKEAINEAKGFLNDLKDKYYSEIKLKSSMSPDQQKAADFFSRYKEEQSIAQEQHERFKKSTNDLFSNNFKGFDFKIGEKKFKYGVSNPNKVAETQSNISNVIGKFLNDKGDVIDPAGYHKAMYAAQNADTIVKHFYEQGKADAIKGVVANSNNVNTEARSSAPSDVTIGGLKVKAINGLDSSKLKIKNTRFKN